MPDNQVAAELYVELSASATIGDFDFTVTGKIPRLSTQSAVSFMLLVKVQGLLDSVNPTDLVKDLTNGGYVFDAGELQQSISQTSNLISRGKLLPSWMHH